MAHIVRLTERYAYVTLALPRRSWDEYEDQFPDWPDAVITLRDQVMGQMHMMHRKHDRG